MKYALVAAVLMGFCFSAIGCSDDVDHESYRKTTVTTPSGHTSSVETKVKSSTD